MNTKQAITKLRKLLGPTAGLRDIKTATSPELREQQRTARIAANAVKTAAQEAMEARQRALLATDPEYQRLKAEYVAARAAQEKCPHGHTYRYTAGRSGSMFFSVEAQADTLDELIDVVQAEQTKRAA